MEKVRLHYEHYPYPHYPLLARVKRVDTYAINLTALWGHFNGQLPPLDYKKVLVAGCGTFSPYPFALSNPDCRITALDLSQKSLNRARLHCLINGCFNVNYQSGDLLDSQLAPGPYGLIDAFGVLHHLVDPLEGLMALKERLAPGGIIRVMLYSKGARGSTEAARRALRRAGIKHPLLAKLFMLRHSSSRISGRLRESPESSQLNGLADAFLHPLVHTFSVSQLKQLVNSSGLKVFRFAHHGALPDPAQEFERLDQLELSGALDFNFILYLGNEGIRDETGRTNPLVMTNPAITSEVRKPYWLPFRISPRLGSPLPCPDKAARSLLRHCLSPTPLKALADAQQQIAIDLEEKLLLIRLYA